MHSGSYRFWQSTHHKYRGVELNIFCTQVYACMQWTITNFLSLGGICVHNAQQHQTVLDSLPSLHQRRHWLPRLKSKANEAHAKAPSGPRESFRTKIDTQKMSKGSTEHNLCDSTSRGASDAVGNAIAGSSYCNNALQGTVMTPLFSAQYGPRNPSRDAFRLLKYMPWKGNLCKSKVAWAVTSRTRSSSNLAAAVAIEVPTIPNGTCLGSTQTLCTQCTATPNRLGFSTVSASTEVLATTTQEQSKQGTCKRAKWPERKLSNQNRHSENEQGVNRTQFV